MSQKSLLLSAMVMFGLGVQAQVSGPDYYIDETGVKRAFGIPSADQRKSRIDELPKFTIDNSRLKKAPLPTKVNNAELKYFRPIHNQGSDGSCSQGSGMGYGFTYEMNRINDTDASLPENQFPIYFTWNFLNFGDGNGTFNYDGFEIAKSNGIPTVADCGGHVTFDWEDKKWISGYDKYYHGMHFRIDNYYSLDVGTPEGLETLKHWFHDRGNGSASGGIANFGGGNDRDTRTLPSASDDSGKDIIIEWNHGSEHAMTFVGYNDEVKYDWNGDGQYTNDKDITGDGKINMEDWEIGGLIVANTYGTGWGDNGFKYMMYRLLAVDMANNGGIGDEGRIMLIKGKENYKPQMTYKVSLKHNSRENLQILAGVSSDLNATEPEHTKHFKLFMNQGGAFPMDGSNSASTFEIGLDISELLCHIAPDQEAKFFLELKSSDGSGTMESFTLMDYTNGEAGLVQTASSSSNETMAQGTNFYSVNYTLNHAKVGVKSTTLPGAKVDEPYTTDLEASNGSAPFKWLVDWKYEREEFTASYPNTTGSKIVTDHEDDGFGSQELAFDFPFYGKLYSKMSVSTNGILIFEDATNADVEAKPILNPFHADVDQWSGAITYSGDANSATIRYKGGFFCCSGSMDATVKLYPSGVIEFFLSENMTDNRFFFTGIQDGNGNEQIDKLGNTSNIPTNYAYRLTPPSYPIGMELSSDGTFSGIPTEDKTVYNIPVRIVDNNGVCGAGEVVFGTKNDLAVNENEISQNFAFPNPMKETTAINFTLKTAADVQIDILDIHGRLIERLANGSFAAGNQSINWNASTVESGVYLYRLLVNNQVYTDKLTVLK